MAKDPALLFYTSDFLTGTMTMSNEQVGKYIRLLCLQHQKGILAEKDMIYVCGSYDKDIYDKFIKDDTGFWNKRLRFEADKRANYSKSRSINRLNKIKKKATKHMKKICNSYEDHMENENENENINKSFNSFWLAYPKKIGKGMAEKAWNKINKPVETCNLILQALVWQKQSEQWTKDNGQFIPYPATYLNQRRWEDEPTTNNKTGIDPACPNVPEWVRKRFKENN